MRTLVVGDVHGCLDELDALLALAGFRRGADRLVLLGDLLDRGPDGPGVVRRARELGAECVLGNHDEKHLRWAAHQARLRADASYRVPMKPLAPEDARQHALLSADDLAWLSERPFFLRLEHPWVAVHGGFLPGRPIERQKPQLMLRLRRVDAEGTPVALGADVPGARPWAEAWRGPESVVYGHAVHSLEQPRVDTPAPGVRCIGLDTGCVFGGHLSALALPSCEVVQVKARRAWAQLAAETGD